MFPRSCEACPLVCLAILFIFVIHQIDAMVINHSPTLGQCDSVHYLYCPWRTVKTQLPKSSELGLSCSCWAHHACLPHAYLPAMPHLSFWKIPSRRRLLSFFLGCSPRPLCGYDVLLSAQLKFLLEWEPSALKFTMASPQNEKLNQRVLIAFLL